MPVYPLMSRMKMPKKLCPDGLARDPTARFPGAIMVACKGRRLDFDRMIVRFKPAIGGYDADFQH